MRTINEISDAVRRGERISIDDAITLWREAPMWLLGELATERKRKVSGQHVYYNRNVHLEPSNICLFNCEFCSFRRREGDPDAWFMTIDEVEARAMELKDKDITEVHIVGGVHPTHTLDSYCEMIRRVKGALPHVSVKAYTAVELFYMIRKAEVSIVEGLRRLMDAGMDSIPGGGAEIFDETLRKKICPDKCSSEEWLAVHRAAHHMGLHTNCTMLYGHVESIEQRVDHLNRLRELQESAPGFDAFIPLKYRSRNNRMSDIGECSVEDDLRTIAMSRIFLDNIPHIKAYWVAYGKAITELALAYGADDIDGTIDDTTKIYSMAGADARPTMSVEELEALVRDAGFVPVERDTHYNVVKRGGEGVEAIDMAESDVTPAAPEEQAVAVDDVVATEEDTTCCGNSENMAKKQSFKQKMKSFWQGMKRAYKRFPILFHILFIIIFLMCVVFGLYLGLKWGTRHDEVITLPNFVGMDVNAARSLAKQKELEIVIREEVVDDEMMPGLIIDQMPSLSDVRTVTVKPGRRVYLTIISDKREVLAVPYVARQPITPALQHLMSSGFTIDELIYEPTERFANQVLGQMVNGREMTDTMEVMMPRGAGVSLRISYLEESPDTQVPIVVGSSLHDARTMLWEAGLNVGDVVYDKSVDMRDRRATRVYMQGLGPHKMVRYGEPVALYMSEDDALVDSLSREAVYAAKANVYWRKVEAAMLRAEEQIRGYMEQQRVKEALGEGFDEWADYYAPRQNNSRGRYDLHVDESGDDYDDFFNI